jgi:AcrR family transcriptional regulator
MVSVSFPPSHPPHRFVSATDDPRARQLVEAAYELLDEAGLEGLTIRAVLARTGLARRAFYENFSGKDDLVLAVFEETIRLAAEHYRHRASTLADPMERLEMIISSLSLGAATVDDLPGANPGRPAMRRSAALAREHLRLADTRPRELQAALAPLLALVAEQLQDGVAAGQVRACDPDLQAALIYNLVSTTIHTELIAEEDARPDLERRLRLAEQVWDFCRRAIAA